MLRSLEALLAAIERHDPQRQLLFVGDFVNRGPDSKGVLDLLLTLKEAHFVRGNHDDVFDQVISGLSYCGKPGEESRIASFKWFMEHGLDKTLLSYGVPEGDLRHALRRPTTINLDLLVENVPPAHKKFLRNLPVVLETDDMFVAHAKWDVFATTQSPPISERLRNSEAMRYTLLWGRYRIEEIDTDKPWERVGYFGHTPVDSYTDLPELVPVLGPQIVLLDTAAALLPQGRLTAVCHESGAFIQVDPQGWLVQGP